VLRLFTLNHALPRSFDNKHNAKGGIVRVFVSSTWIDLENERESVEQVLQRFRETKFVGMEYFGSQPQDVRSTSLAEIPDCQLYIGIVGSRYGSGITEAEYRTAREHHLPCLIYFKRGGLDIDCGELDQFRDDLRREHTVTEFSDASDLAAHVASDLHNWLFDHWLPRWFLHDSVGGMSALAMDYASRVQNFLSEYLGTEGNPVPFGGRGRELAQLDEWLDDANAPPYALLAAPAGRGKSALCVRWSCAISGRPRTHAIFLPVSIRFRTNLASVVFASLATRLAAAFGEDVQAGADTTVDMWRGVVQSYLRRPLPDGRRIVVVLDGLDEAADWHAGADLFPREPLAGLKILVTTRYRAGETGCGPWLETLGWTRALAKSIELPALTCDGVRDVVVSMGAPLDKLGSKVDLIWELFRLSEGDPMVVRLYVDDLWTRGREVSRLRPEDLRSISPGLEGYFQRWWREQRTLWDKDAPLRQNTVQVALNLLACALGPMAADDLLALAPAELNTWVLEDALESLERFIIGDGRSQRYVFSHPRLGIYFYELLRPVERRLWDNRFLQWGEKTLTSLQGAQPQESVSPYLVQYYGAHLERSGADLSALLALVADGWKFAWFAFEGGYTGFLNDVDRAWRAAERDLLGSAGPREHDDAAAAAVLCALCFASVRSLATNVRPGLLAALVDKAIWTPAQALAFVRHAPSREYRQAGLIAILEALPPGLLEQAVSIAEDRVPPALIGRLARHGNGERAMGLIHLPCEISWLAESLTAAGRYLKPPAVDAALAMAASLPRSDRIAPVLSLAAALPMGRRQELLERELQIAIAEGGRQSIESLAAALGADSVGRVADTASFPIDDTERWLALAILAHNMEPQKSAPVASRIVAEMDDRAGDISQAGLAGALGYICPLLDASTRERLLEKVQWERVSSTAVAPFVFLLDPLRIRRLLGLGISSPSDRLHLIPVLRNVISDDIWDELLLDCSNDVGDLEALASHCRDLPERIQRELYVRLVREQEWECGVRLLAPCLTIAELDWANQERYPSLSQDGPLCEALAVRLAELGEWPSAFKLVDGFPKGAIRDRMLCSLAPIVEEHPASAADLLDRASKAFDVPEVLGRSAGHLPRNLVLQALDTSQHIDDHASQTTARRALAEALFQAGSLDLALSLAFPECGRERDTWLAEQAGKMGIPGNLRAARLIQDVDIRDGWLNVLFARIRFDYFGHPERWLQSRADDAISIVKSPEAGILWRRLELLVASTAADIPDLIHMAAELSPAQQIAAVETVVLRKDEGRASVMLAGSLANPLARAEAFGVIFLYKKNTFHSDDRAAIVNIFCVEAAKGRPASEKWAESTWGVIGIASSDLLQGILDRFATFDDKVKVEILRAFRTGSTLSDGTISCSSLDFNCPMIWESIKRIENRSTRAGGFAAALRLVPADQMPGASREALAAAREAMTADPKCSAPFVSVCEFIGEADWTEAWLLAKAIPSEDDRANAIRALASKAPASQMEAAVQFALKVRRSRPNAFWLGRLAEELPEPFRSRVFGAAFRVARRRNEFVWFVLERLSEAEVSMAVRTALKFNDTKAEAFAALWNFAADKDRNAIRQWFDEESKRRGKNAESWMIGLMPPKALLEKASSITDPWERMLFLRRIDWRLEEPEDLAAALALLRDIVPWARAETVEEMILNTRFTHRVAAEEAIRLFLAGYSGQRPLEMLKATKDLNTPDWNAAATGGLEKALFAAAQDRNRLNVPLLAKIADGLAIESRKKILVKLLRFLAEGTRAEMLDHFSSFLPWVAAAGGTSSLEACVEGLRRVVRWWP
jgi:hypothetical protein